MFERQADNHTGEDVEAMASIPMARNIISVQILEYATKQISYSLYNFKDHIVPRICDDYIAPRKYYGAEKFECSYSRNLIYIPENL